MLGDGQILKPLGPSGLDRLAESRAPVACAGVTVQIAPQVGAFHRHREKPVAFALDLASVLPKPRRDTGQGRDRDGGGLSVLGPKPGSSLGRPSLATRCSCLGVWMSRS